MIITCERCVTRFRLDPAKIPEAGARVRCSRCEHSFVVASPSHSDLDQARDLAREASASASQPGDIPGADAGSERGAAESEGESDWEFNDDGAISATSPGGDHALDPAAPGDAVDDLAAARAVDDLLAGSGPTPTAPTRRGSGGPEIAAAPDSAAGPASSASWDTPVDDELGDPGEWDLFDSDPSTTYAEVPPPDQAQTRVEAEGVAPSEPLVGLPVRVASKLGDESLWQRRAGEVAGWLLVAVLVLAGLHGGLLTRSGAEAGQGRWSGAGFDVDQVEGHWVENAVAGPIYLVSGRVRRVAQSAGPRAQQLGIRLFDSAGRRLTGVAAVGPAIPEPILRESSPADLALRQQRRAARFAARKGAWHRFDAVVAALPDSAERFELEVR